MHLFIICLKLFCMYSKWNTFFVFYMYWNYLLEYTSQNIQVFEFHFIRIVLNWSNLRIGNQLVKRRQQTNHYFWHDKETIYFANDSIVFNFKLSLKQKIAHFVCVYENISLYDFEKPIKKNRKFRYRKLMYMNPKFTHINLFYLLGFDLLLLQFYT